MGIQHQKVKMSDDKCKRCKFAIKDEDSEYAITALGGTFHKSCFRCTTCDQQLFSISKFFEKDGFPQCRTCQQRKGPKCHGCGKEIAEVDHATYGPLHFCASACIKCSVCKKVCPDNDRLEDEGQMFHLGCLS